MEFSHYSVLYDECLNALDIKPDGLYVDCTAGGGGHSLGIAKRLTEGGRLIAIDRDADAIEAVKKRLEGYEERVEIVHANFSFLKEILKGREPDGVLIDLGVSSYQIDTPERGFSYNHDARLDMRMDRDAELDAFRVVNEYPESELARIIFEYGEEKMARRIARRIVSEREKKPIETTKELAKLVSECVPKDPKNPGASTAKRTFQAIRIEVNNELGIIAPTVKDIAEVLKKGGRMAVITFHSLEDREVKSEMQRLENPCTCPKDFPVCVCGRKPLLKVLAKKPILPGEKELAENKRSHSAKLRIAEKI